MTEVKNLAFVDKNKLKTLNSFIESELDLSVFSPFPLDFIHHFFPLKLKFLKESFVAIEDKKIKGLITVNKTGKKQIKITRLLLEENSLEVGKILINCATSHYLSKGAESFYVVINKLNLPLLNMLTFGCGFRDFAKETLYEIPKQDFNVDDSFSFDFIREVKKGETKQIKEFVRSITGNIYRNSDFNSLFESNFVFLEKQKKFIIYDSDGKRIISYFSLSKLNKSDYLLNFAILPVFEEYILDIIKYVKTRILPTAKEFSRLLVSTKSYYVNYDELNKILSFEYKNSICNEILIRDFLVAKKQAPNFERMIFNDPTPAF